MKNNQKAESYQRYCKFCGNLFPARTKHSKVCSFCKNKNNRMRTMKTLHLL